MEDNGQGPRTVIGEDVEIVGSIKCSGNIVIDGKLSGDLTCNGNAVIGGTAQVKGNLNVQSVSIHGQMNGNINAKDKIEMKASANLNGDIRGKRLSVEDGVTFIGKSEVNPSGPGTAAARPAAPDAAQDDAGRDDAAAQDGKGKGGLLAKK